MQFHTFIPQTLRVFLTQKKYTYTFEENNFTASHAISHTAQTMHFGAWTDHLKVKLIESLREIEFQGAA